MPVAGEQHHHRRGDDPVGAEGGGLGLQFGVLTALFGQGRVLGLGLGRGAQILGRGGKGCGGNGGSHRSGPRARRAARRKRR